MPTPVALLVAVGGVGLNPLPDLRPLLAGEHLRVDARSLVGRVVGLRRVAAGVDELVEDAVIEELLALHIGVGVAVPLREQAVSHGRKLLGKGGSLHAIDFEHGAKPLLLFCRERHSALLSLGCAQRIGGVRLRALAEQLEEQAVEVPHRVVRVHHEPRLALPLLD